MSGMRHSFRVALSLPIRVYLRRWPIARGKGFITRRILRPLLPAPPSSFVAKRPDGSRVKLYYREVLGYTTLVLGQFEGPECLMLCRLAREGSVAIDVGANVGVMTIPLARAVGPAGLVVAVEPLETNVQRLRANADLNEIKNVVIRQVAAAQNVAQIEFQVAEDAAYGSTRSIGDRMARTGVVTVESLPLDMIWADLRSPAVSIVKVDVEGAEAGVILGAHALLQRDRPVLMLEANTAKDLAALTELLKPYGYTEQPSPGFRPWNHLFAVGELAG